MTRLPTRDEVFSAEAGCREELFDALSDSRPLSELDDRKREWWRSVEDVFAYLAAASLRGERLDGLDYYFFAVMQAMAQQVRSGRLPEPLDIAMKQGDRATALERRDIANAVLYLLAADDPLSPVSNRKPRAIVAARFGVTPKTVSNWKSKHVDYLANQDFSPEYLRREWLAIIQRMKLSGRRYAENKKGGKRLRV